MNFRLSLEYPELSATEKSLVHLLVQVETPPISESPDRRPLVVGLAIDKSKSMYGEKIAATLEAASALVNWLTRHDHLAIIAYDSQVEVIQPLTPLTDKFSVIKKLENIHVGTSTNLSGGWLQALRAVEAADVENAFRRVILLTDGMANTGVVATPELIKIAEDHYKRKTSTTTIGFGRDFSESLLREISQAGGGNFFFIEGPEQAHEVFFKEFGDIAALYGQGLEIKIHPSPGVIIKELINDVPHTFEANGDVVLRPGDLRSDDVRNIVIMMEVDGTLAGENQGPLITSECSYYNMIEGSRMERFDSDVAVEFKPHPSSGYNRQVRLEALLAASGRTMIEASRVASEKDLSAAREIILRMIERLTESRPVDEKTIDAMIQRLKEMEHNLEENLNVARKHMMASGAQISTRSALGDMIASGRPAHNKIMEIPLSGQLDLYRCPELKSEVKLQIEQGYRFVIFELTELNYIDSSGIGALIQISNWMKKRNGLMVLTNTQGSVEKIFHMSKLDEFFVFRDSVADGRLYLKEVIASLSN